MDDDLIDRVANDLAAGRPVDWPAVFAAARDGKERQQLAALQQIQDIFASQRSDDRDTEPASEQPTENPTEPPSPSAPVHRPPSPADSWGRYHLIQEVGSGTFGAVYRAQDAMLGLDVAIKVLHRHFDDDVLKQRLVDEGRALAKVRNNNVVRVIGIEFNGDRAGLCMEFIEGETLEGEVRHRGTCSLSQAAEVGKAVCQALAAVHQAGFIHRDVKARNIMRERDTGRIVLMDFGAGRYLDQELSASRRGIDGTAIYMAPEVLETEPSSRSSDVYSIGVLIYYVLTGAYPVEGHSLGELRDAHRKGLRTALGSRRPDLPPAFLRVVEKAIAPQRRDRYATPTALCDDLEMVTSSQRPPWLRRLAVAALAAVAALLVLTGLGFVSTYYTNTVLGRTDFVDEGPLEWLRWGAKGTLAPLVIAAFTLLIVTLVLEGARLLKRIWGAARRAEQSAMAWIHRWSLDDVSVLASASLLMSATVLFATWWYFGNLIGALWSIYPDVSTVPMEGLRLLSPEFGELHFLYRKAFIGTTIACVMLWYPALRLAYRTRQRIPFRVAAAGAAVLLFFLLLLDFPYRLLSHDIDFKEVSWSGNECHLLGERGDERLIFCATLPPPRNKTVKASEIVVHPDAALLAGLATKDESLETKKKRSLFKNVLRKQGLPATQ